MKSKQEVIQQHYIDLLNADKFFKLKPHIDEDGWCLMFDEKGEKVSLTFKELGFEKDPLGKTVACLLTQKGHKWRPKSLFGIETNNGWNPIASEADLPKEDGKYKAVLKQDKFEWLYDNFWTPDEFGPGSRDKWLALYSHWKPLEEEKAPLY